MALPVGVTSGLAHIDAPVSFGGTPAKVYLEVVANVALNHIATGTPIANFIDVRTPGEGQPATVTLPHTDQAGFQDESGAPVTNWSYKALIRYELDGQLIHIPEKHFQILTGQDDIDLALIPVGQPTEIILGNVAFVSSVNGESGAVTLDKADVGLANVSNTSDANKPISTATQAALDAKAPINSPTFTGTVSGVSKAMVGLGNVDNTSDAAKPVSTAQQAALDAKAPLASPTFTGTVSGVTKTHVGLGNVDNTSDANKPVSTATQTALSAKAPIASPTFTGTVGGITKAMVGLGNVDNTADTAKPVSTAQQTALDAKAPLASPSFTGTVSGITKAMVGLGSVDNTADSAKPVSTAQAAADALLAKGVIFSRKITTNTGAITTLAVVQNIASFTFTAGRHYRIEWDTDWYGASTNNAVAFQIATALTTDAAAATTGLTVIGLRNAQSSSANVSARGGCTAYFDPGANTTVQIKFLAAMDGVGTNMVVQGNRAGGSMYRIYDEGSATVAT